MAEGLDFALRYPFSESAKKSLEGIDLNERIIDLAVERIRKALRGEPANRMLFHESEKKEDIASFAASRMILGYLRNSFVTNRFAVNESKTVHSFLNREDEKTVDAVASQFGIVTSAENGSLTISLPAYLKYRIRGDTHYALIRRRLRNGRVEIKPDEKKRLIEPAVKMHIENIPIVKDPPDLIKSAGEKIIAELPKTENRELIAVKAGDHPPCVARILEEMKKHENLSHQARLFIAAYFLKIGMGEAEVAGMFSSMPDYSEKITTYQVSHIKKKGYSVPSCATVMTYGLCCAVCRIGSPVNWHTLDEERKKTIKSRGA